MVLPMIAAIAAAEPKTKVSLVFSHAAARPGETITAAVKLVSEPGWHTYWRNAGDAGSPTTVEWKLPAGITAGQIQWPVPEKLIISKLTDYVYDKETLLLVTMTVAADAKLGSMNITGAVSWLECSDKSCVPQDGKVAGTLVIANESKPSDSGPLIEEWRGYLPKVDPNLVAKASWESTTDAKTRKLIVEWVPNEPVAKPDFYPYESDNYTVQAATELLEGTAQIVRLRKTVQLTDGSWPERIGGLVLNKTEGEHPTGYEVTLQTGGTGASTAPVAATAAGTGSAGAVELPSGSSAPTLLGILGLAFLGGLILNVMPCVLPVIALKILGFVNQSRKEPGKVRQLGIFYMLGVLTSFLILAGIILAARRAAGDVNWGIQMQNPYFVVGMTALVTLVALNLWGVFEITLPGSALSGAGELASREGPSGAFYNGVLATLLATPCTAPALGVAVGAVLTKPALILILTFLTIGFGLALPYVLLSWNPKWLKLLPKPGAWMEKFKMAMGFPMAATAVWLLSFGSKHFARSGTLWLGLFLVMLALSAWVYGEFVQRGSRHRGFAAGLAVLILFGGYAYTLEAKLHWRRIQEVSDSGDELFAEPGGIPWKRWSPEAVAKARESGRPVLVEFTADWCLLCQLNKESSIDIDSVKTKIKELNVAPFLADFTRRDKRIGQVINEYKRAGVPLVLVYPADKSAPAIVLPEVLKPNIVLNALEMAANSGPAQPKPQQTVSANLQ